VWQCDPGYGSSLSEWIKHSSCNVWQRDPGYGSSLSAWIKHSSCNVWQCDPGYGSSWSEWIKHSSCNVCGNVILGTDRVCLNESNTVLVKCGNVILDTGRVCLNESNTVWKCGPGAVFVNSLEQTSPWKVCSCSVGQEIPHLLQNHKTNYRIQKIPPLILFLSQMNPIHTLIGIFCFLKTSHIHLGIPSGLYPIGFLTKFCYNFSSLSNIRSS